jgi:hypothetical protein
MTDRERFEAAFIKLAEYKGKPINKNLLDRSETHGFYFVRDVEAAWVGWQIRRKYEKKDKTSS